MRKREPNGETNSEIKEMRHQLQEGLEKMEQKMESLEKKVATANKNASMIRGLKAEEELRKDL